MSTFLDAEDPQGAPPVPALAILPDMSYHAHEQHTYPSSAYYPPPVAPHDHGFQSSPMVIRTEPSTKPKRPKYTRSKSGCLTCRQKKIKCDEAKPSCMRCTHGQRDCTWPDESKARKKSAPRKDSTNVVQYETSNGGSPGVSEGSSTRGFSPPGRDSHPLDQPTRRHSEPFHNHQHAVKQELEVERRQSIPQGYHPVHHQPPHHNVLNMIPETAAYPAMYLPKHGHPHTPPDYHLGESSRSSSSSRPQSSSGGHSMSPMAGYHSQAPPMSAHRAHHTSQQQSLQWSPPLLTHVDAIEPYFHNPQERNLIRHYCNASLHIIMAVPSENSVAGANLPLIFGRPPGDITSEALANSLLAVAAIHRSFLLSQSGVTSDGADEMLQVAHTYRMHSKTLLAQACATAEGTYSDASLAACLAISLTDIFSGGRNWQRNMNLAKTLVSVRGGPAALLAHESMGSSSGPESVSRTRLLLEILAVYDMFGALSTSKEPTILNSASRNWWDDEPHASGSSVESVFGMSRAFIPLLAQVITFVSRVVNGTAMIREVIDGVEPFDQTKECHELYNVLEEWTIEGDLIPRVKAGNTIYRKMLQILLLRDCLNIPLTDPLVQDCANTVLSLCLSCAKSQMGVDLLWPVIIAGSQIFGTDRPCVLDILEEYRSQCCYEVDTASQIIFMVWKRMDQQQTDPTFNARADWRSVIHDFNISILVL